MTQDRFGYWPKGAAYQTPTPVADSLPICPRCSSRHKGATINCDLINDAQEPDGHAED